MPIFGYRAADLRAAQMAVLTVFEQGLGAAPAPPALRVALQGALASVAFHSDPLGRARALADALIQAVAGYADTALAECCRALERQQASVAQLQRVLAVYQRDPLLAQVQRLTEERDQRLAEARVATQRVAAAQTALTQAQTTHAAAVARLEAELAEYKRLVVRLQSGRETS